MVETVALLLIPHALKALVQDLRILLTLRHIAVNLEQRAISLLIPPLVDTGRHLAISTMAVATRLKVCTRIILARRKSTNGLAGVLRRATEAVMAVMAPYPMEERLICKVDTTLKNIRPTIGKEVLEVEASTLGLMAVAQQQEEAMRHLHSIHSIITGDKEDLSQRPPLASTEPLYRHLGWTHSSMYPVDHRRPWEAQDSQVHTNMAVTWVELEEEDRWQEEDKDLLTQEVQ